MIEGFSQFIKDQQLCNFGDRILLAVSGGIDSVIMSHLFFESGYSCAIAHCNFQLRGQDSDADEQFTRGLAARLEMPVHVRNFDVETEMKDQGSSVQMAARDLRYQWFHALADEHGFDAIATAHNLNDSIETSLLNLVRGTGIRGLTGIPSRNGKVIRPLLFAQRKEIEAFALQRGIRHREDSSNRETRYRRNKIRHDVIPVLEQINPSFAETMAETIKRLGETERLLEGQVEKVRKKIFREEEGKTIIEVDILRELAPLDSWLFELFSPYGFSKSQCAGIRNILEAGSGKRSVSPSHQIYKDREQLILVENLRAGFERYYLDGPGKHSSLPFAVDVEVFSRDKLREIPRERSIACLDYDLMEFPLTIRHWQHGDYFFPLGMDQMKKLSDFFVDEKVPVPEKERTWILACGKKIVWVMGKRIDHRFRITENTKRVLILRLQSDVAP
jgi:tRNA(Ile)-lysidine synthase